MSESEQIQHFANELEALVNRFRAEYNMTYASILGVLYLQAHMLCQESLDRS